MYQIVADSSAELNSSMCEPARVSFVPFVINIGDRAFVDDEVLDYDEFCRELDEAKSGVSTACPSPQSFFDAMEGDNIFIVTLSSELSGSYASANIAKGMYLEKHPTAKVHVFDSKSAVCGETGVVIAIQEQLKEGKSFEEIVEATEDIISRSLTIFALNSLENLSKNGRIPKIAGKLSKFLSIKLIARSKDGKIHPLSIERGVNKALNSLVTKAVELCDKTMKCPIIISQANAIASANYVKEKFNEFFPNRNVEITCMKALSTTYAEDGGVVVFL